MPYNNPLEAADVWLVAPIFSSTGLHPVAEARVDLFLEQAENRTEREIWGDKADDAVILMCAHLLYCDVRDNSMAIVGAPAGAAKPTYAGAIASETVGPVSRSFVAGGGSSFVQGGSVAFADEALATTPFGKRLVELRRSLFAGGAY